MKRSRKTPAPTAHRFFNPTPATRDAVVEFRKPPTWSEPGAVWSDRLCAEGYTATSKLPPSKAHFAPLKEILLSIGGWAAVFFHEESLLDAIIAEGAIFDLPILVKSMATSRCHQNSAALYAKYPTRYEIVTGYALSKDGAWRQHSWLYEPKRHRIIETTPGVRETYFGVILTKTQAAHAVKTW